MNKNNLLSFGSLALIVIVILALITLFARPKFAYTDEVRMGLAQALAIKGITMYGAEWCPHCKAEKARFGKAWELVPYVECPQNEKLCLDKGVKGYPTWITPDGTKYEGEQGLEKLSEIAGYDLRE